MALSALVCFCSYAPVKEESDDLSENRAGCEHVRRAVNGPGDVLSRGKFLYHSWRSTALASRASGSGCRWAPMVLRRPGCCPDYVASSASLVAGARAGVGKAVKIPFLRDLAINVRLLIAAPILILSESRIDRRWRTKKCVYRHHAGETVRRDPLGPAAVIKLHL